MKTLSTEELRETGLLQETNRLWFHPLGLALAINVTDHDTPKLEILDAREYPDGFVFDDVDQEKCKNVRAFMEHRHRSRRQSLGYIIQPEPGRTVTKFWRNVLFGFIAFLFGAMGACVYVGLKLSKME